MHKFINQRRIKAIAVASILAGIAIPSLIVVIKHVHKTSTAQLHQLFTPQKVSCLFHDIECADVQKNIAEYLTETLTQKSMTNADQKKICEQLKQQFPIIKQAEWKLLPSQTLHVTIHGTKPHCIVNKQFVIGDHPELLEFEDFTETQITNLPTINLSASLFKNRSSLPKHLYTLLHTLPQKLWDDYSINYKRSTRIELTPKQALFPCKIIADSASVTDAKKWGALNGIVTDLIEQNMVTKKMLQAKHPVVAFDMRLKNRIIVKFFQSMARGRGS